MNFKTKISLLAMRDLEQTLVLKNRKIKKQNKIKSAQVQNTSRRRFDACLPIIRQRTVAEAP